MHLDVKEIRDFYYRSTLGRAARASINKNLSSIWPETNGLNVLGFGFPIPFFAQVFRYFQESSRFDARSNGCVGLAKPRGKYICTS